MPGCAYDQVKTYAPIIYEVDADCALHTIKQICEECISDEICMNFYNGEDDELGNRAESIRFVEWCIDFVHKHGVESWRPYNFDRYEENVALDDEPVYMVYEMVGGGLDGEHMLVVDDKVSKNGLWKIIFEPNVDEKGELTYNKKRIENGKHFDFEYDIFTPVNKKYYVHRVNDSSTEKSNDAND